jgi:hypothetical protein
LCCSVARAGYRLTVVGVSAPSSQPKRPGQRAGASLLRTDMLYEVELSGLTLGLGSGRELDVTSTLSNGRASYLVFQLLVAELCGLATRGEGAGSDLIDAAGSGFEVKSYRDPQHWPQDRYDWFHTAASATFPANNLGPRIKALLEQGDRPGALAECVRTGYAHNDFYIYTNTSGWVPGLPLRFMLAPTTEVRAQLGDDPRLISRRALLAARPRVHRL